jgi:hypothetical protein
MMLICCEDLRHYNSHLYINDLSLDRAGKISARDAHAWGGEVGSKSQLQTLSIPSH